MVDISRPGSVVVELDGGQPPVVATIRFGELSWRHRREDVAQIGRRVSAEVMEVAPDGSPIFLSLAATENPELWAFLKALRPGDRLSGMVVDVRSFGVFVTLDDGPPHPVYPGVGFVTWPDVSWRRIESIADAVSVGERVTGEFLYFDTWQGEARLSLRALTPDPLRAFAERAREGQVFRGPVTKLVPFGAFVEVADGVEGLVHNDDLADEPVSSPEQAVQLGEHIEVTVTEIDLARRRVRLARPSAPQD